MDNIRTVHWPAMGDADTMRTALSWRLGVIWMVAAAAAGAGIQLVDLTTAYVIAASAGIALTVSAVAFVIARRQARAAEVSRSFADLAIVHRGYAIQLGRQPIVGAYATRAAAVRGALAVGSWAIIVRAYGRFYVLAGHRATSINRPVAFRSRAVADIVPSVLSGDEPIAWPA